MLILERSPVEWTQNRRQEVVGSRCWWRKRRLLLKVA
jgi:hypothetical protein